MNAGICKFYILIESGIDCASTFVYLINVCFDFITIVNKVYL